MSSFGLVEKWIEMKPATLHSNLNGIHNLLSEKAIGDFGNSEIRLLVFGNHFDATQYISFYQPASSRDERTFAAFFTDEDLETITYRQNGIALLFDALSPTHVVFSRYAGNHYSLIRSAAGARKIPTICFLDDDLLAVPKELGPVIYKLFNSRRMKTLLRPPVMQSDCVLCSTKDLQKKIQRHTATPVRFSKIYKSVTEHELAEVPSIRTAGPPTIGYMASSSHAHDLKAWLPQLKWFLTKNSNVRMGFFGTIAIPKELSAFSNRIDHYDKAIGYEEFLATLGSLGWTIGLAPLADIPFNHSKAPTKWVEYTLAGIPTIASNVLPYQSVLKNNAAIEAGPANLADVLGKYLRDPGTLQRTLEASRKLLKAEYGRKDHVADLIGHLNAATAIVAGRR